MLISVLSQGCNNQNGYLASQILFCDLEYYVDTFHKRNYELLDFWQRKDQNEQKKMEKDVLIHAQKNGSQR